MGLLRGPADGERAAGLPPRALARVQGHLPALSDDARATASSARAAGTATACRWRSPSNRSSASPRRRRSRSRSGSSASTRECRESVFAFLEEWNRLTERIGFWLDLEHAYRTLDESYIESVWWALAQIDGRGLLYEGHKVVPYCPRCETTLSSHEVALGYRDVVDPSVYLKLPRARAATERLLVWTTTPWTLPGNVAVAVVADGRPTCGCASAGRCSCSPRSASRRCSARTPRSLERFSGRELRGALRLLRGPDLRRERPRAGRRCRSSPTTSSRPRTAPASCTSRRPSARTTTAWPRPPQVPFDPTTAAHAVQPGAARRHLRRARARPRRRAPTRGASSRTPQLTEELIDDLRERGLLLRVRGLRALLPALLALRHAADLLRQTVLVHRHLAAARASCSRRTRRSPGTRRTSSTGASATGWRTTSTGRSRASATGARRCRCGAARGATCT